jgi:hypothetical protein
VQQDATTKGKKKLHIYFNKLNKLLSGHRPLASDFEHKFWKLCYHPQFRGEKVLLHLVGPVKRSWTACLTHIDWKRSIFSSSDIY